MEKKNYIVGIDIGSSNIVMVVGSKDESGKMVVDALVSKPSSGVNAGMIENINQVSTCLKAAKAEIEEEVNIRISEAYAGVSGAFIRCAPLSDHVYIREPQAGISQADVDALFLRMKEVVAPENEEIMERIPQNYTVDSGQEVKDPVGSFGRRLSSTFNFILCEKTPLERLKMVFRHSGLQLAGVYANSMIVSDVVVSADEKSDGVAVVDIGGATTDVAVYHGGIIRHLATIPMGGKAIDYDIHLHGVPERSVEALKKKYGSAIAEFVSEQKLIQIPSMRQRSNGVLRRNLAAIIEARLTDIAEFVRAEIKDSGFAGRLGCGVVLTGGSASIEHIDELFRRVTGLDVRVATAEIGLDETSREQIGSPSHTAAVALLLKGAEQGACSVSERLGGYVPPRPAVTPVVPPVTPSPSHSVPQSPKEPVNKTESESEDIPTQAVNEPQKEPAKSGGGSWFDRVIKTVTDRINNSFDESEDEEI